MAMDGVEVEVEKVRYDDASYVTCQRTVRSVC
jgi:hypothetical protein